MKVIFELNNDLVLPIIPFVGRKSEEVHAKIKELIETRGSVTVSERVMTKINCRLPGVVARIGIKALAQELESDNQ